MDADAAPDTASDTKWLTFNEIAENRGISVPSAMRLVRRRRWRRQRDNRGHVLVAVPIEEIRQADDEPDASQAISAIRSAYETTIETLRDQIAAKEEVAELLRQQLASVKLAADISDATSAELREALEAANAAARELRGRLEELEAAEERRRGQGRWARLRAAWRDGRR